MNKTQKIELTQGKFTLVDDEDFERVAQYKWRFHGGYAVRNSATDSQTKKRDTLLLHRFILKTPIGKETDHINRDKLDNRKSNLRVCTKSQNQRNKPININNTTGYKGVTLVRGKLYQAQATVNGKCIYIGCSPIVTKAAKMYDEYMKKLDPDFSYLNFLENDRLPK